MINLEKQHQHFVPQFWIRGFANHKNQIYSWDGKQISIVSARKIMQMKWLYTLFGKHWVPTNVLEDALSKLESQYAVLFKKFQNPSNNLTENDRMELCSCLALQACRHPDVMNRGRRLAEQFGTLIAQVHTLGGEQNFITEAAKFGISQFDAGTIYWSLITKTPDQLQEELNELKGLSPQDLRLPLQEALRAESMLFDVFCSMDLTLLDAPPTNIFVLGDTPISQSGIGQGFSVPLSQSIAIKVVPANTIQKILSRRLAIICEVDQINKEQWENAAKIVIGPDPNILKTL